MSTWDGEERRNDLKRQVNRNLIIFLVIVVALVVGGGSYANSRRQADLLNIACENAHGHRELTIAVRQAAEQVNRIAIELGLPIDPVEVEVPNIPDECMEQE